MQNQKTETNQATEKTTSILKKREATEDISEFEPVKKTQTLAQSRDDIYEESSNKRVKK